MLLDFAKFELNFKNPVVLKNPWEYFPADPVARHGTIRDIHRHCPPYNTWQGSSHFHFLRTITFGLMQILQ